VAAAGIIAAEARRLERLVGDLLDLATLQARRFALQTRPVDLEAAAAATAASFAPAASELGLALVTDSALTGDSEPGRWVLADPDRLAQVTANLIENAMRYADHEVRVTTVGRPGRAELSVADDGPGPNRAEPGVSPAFRARGPTQSAHRFWSRAEHRGPTGRRHGRVGEQRVADRSLWRDPDGHESARRHPCSHERERGKRSAQHDLGVHAEHPFQHGGIDRPEAPAAGRHTAAG
jgi:hypothetical protein